MPKFEEISSYSRMQRSLQESPIPEMIADLEAGYITPVSSTNELRMRYRKHIKTEAEAKTFMTHACRAHAATVGSVLAVTDRDGKICFGYVPDPGLEMDDPEMLPACQTLWRMIDQGHAATVAASRPKSDPRKSVECPIFAMPAFDYDRSHGQAVEAYGTYLTSFRLRVPAAETHLTPAN